MGTPRYKGQIETTDLIRLPGQGSTPANPPSGLYDLYVKNNGKVYILDSAGFETELALLASQNLSNNNILLNAFRIAINGGLSRLNMVDGVVDEFEDETGVDNVASTNESYDATDDLYESTVTDYSESSLTGATLSGQGDSGDTEYRNAQSFQLSAAASVTQVDVKFGSTTGTPSGQVTCRIETDNSGSPSGTLVHANATKAITPTASALNSFIFDNAFSLSGSTKYWIVLANDNQATANRWHVEKSTSSSYANGGFCLSSDGGATWAAESGTDDLNFKVHARYVDGLTLISESVTAEAEPDEGHLILFEEDVDSITLNTDLKGWISRDGGTTYTQVTLTDEGNYQTGQRILSGTADISGQPTGTLMKWKVTTLNGKEIKLHGVALEWK